MDSIFLLDSQEEFEKALKDVVNNFYYWKDETCPTEKRDLLVEAREDIKKLLRDTQFNIESIPEILESKGWDTAKVTFLTQLLNDNKIELLYSSLITQNSEHGETINNFDWILKLVLGTSELNTLKYPLLQLILYSESNGIHKKCSYDVSKDLLSKLIGTLESLDENM